MNPFTKHLPMNLRSRRKVWTDHSLRQSKNIIFGWTTGQTRSFIDKLTSVIPSLGFLSDPFKGAKLKTSTPHRVLGNADFQAIFSNTAEF